MANNEEVLMVSIEARISELEKGMKKAQGVANAAYAGMKRSSRSAFKDMEQDAARSTSRINQALSGIGSKVGKFGLAFGGGILGGIAAGGLTGIAASVRAVASSFAELGNEAKTAGLNVEDFQRWRYVADQNKIGVDALIDGFKELNLRADEYIQTGKGSAAESFQRLGMTPEEVKTRIKDPSKFMLELIDRTRRLKDTAAGVRIFDELFGGSGGEQFVRLIEQGRQGITDTLNEANKMGAVFDEQFIQRADEVDKKFQQLSTTMSVGVKGAIIEAARALEVFISNFNSMEEKTMAGLQAEMSLLKARKEQLQTEKGGTGDGFLKLFGKNAASQEIGVDEEIAKIQAEMDRRGPIQLKTIVVEPPVTPIIPPSKGGGAKKSDADRQREKAIKQAEREREAVLNLISELEFEASLVGKTALEKEKMVAVRRAGAAATDEEKAKIEALIETTYRQNEAIDRAQAQMEELNDAGRDFAGTLIDGMLNGEKAIDAVKNALSQLADRFINSGLDALFGMGGNGGGGLFGGLLGGVFGGGGGSSDPWAGLRLPGYANGTNFASGGPAWVGERGPEIVNLPRGASVTPNHMLGGQGGQQTVRVEIETKFQNNGEFKNYIKSEVQDGSRETFKQGIKEYDRGSAYRTARDLRTVRDRGFVR